MVGNKVKLKRASWWIYAVRVHVHSSVYSNMLSCFYFCYLKMTEFHSWVFSQDVSCQSNQIKNVFHSFYFFRVMDSLNTRGQQRKRRDLLRGLFTASCRHRLNLHLTAERKSWFHFMYVQRRCSDTSKLWYILGPDKNRLVLILRLLNYANTAWDQQQMNYFII